MGTLYITLLPTFPVEVKYVWGSRETPSVLSVYHWRFEIPGIGYEMRGEDKVWGHHLVEETLGRKFPCLHHVLFGTESGGV
jgi:hypothetical protein